MPVPLPPALVPFLEVLRCPACRAALQPDVGVLRCRSGHTFDLARQGYVSLLSGSRARSGDDAAMVRARASFLATGRYAPVRRAVAAMAAGSLPERGTVVDVGCGTGYYLAGVLDQRAAARGLGLDSSARALRSAARVHPRAAAASWDVFQPFPLADRACDVLLDVFAPRNPAEFHRVLRPAGRLVVARPTERHLAELRDRIPGMVTIDPAKERRLHEALSPWFDVVRTDHVEYRTALTPSAALDLVGMTPSARHLDRTEPADVGALPEQVTVSVAVSGYRPRAGGQPHQSPRGLCGGSGS